MHHRDRCLYRCKVTDANGNVVYSEPGEILTGQIVWDFSYDANGMRTKRTNGTTTYEYVYNGGSLSYMSVDGNTLYFSYGADGDPVCVLYNGLKYFYATNLQGDVTAILDRTGNAVVEYTYDAWGNILTTTGSMADTLGAHNPLRYRGYVYDQETNLYYLSSRYYDPQVGRFINADAFVSTGQGLLGNNMFAYCLNNPVRFVDWHGNMTYDSLDDSPLDDEEIRKKSGEGGGGNSSSTALTNTSTGGSRGFRQRLQQSTGQDGSGSDAHHIFPQKYTKQFQDLGIDNQNPQYGSWWESSSHRQSSYEYNQWWHEFFNTPDITSDDAFSLVEFLSQLFGFDLNY